MKFIVLLLLVFNFITARRLGGNGGGSNSNREEGVRVQAVGVATGVPDAVSIRFTVSHVEKTNEEALAATTKTAKVIKEKLFSSNVVDSDNYQSDQLYTHAEYKYDKALQENKIIGYRTSQSFNILIKKTEDSGPTVGYIVAAGGNDVTVNTVTPIITNKDSVAREAREIAVKNALDKAHDYARLLGSTLGPAIYINEFHSPEARGGGGSMMRKGVIAMSAEMGEMDSAPEIDVGTRETRVSIEARWSLKSE
jgi:uncharacterized protein YggE